MCLSISLSITDISYKNDEVNITTNLNPFTYDAITTSPFTYGAAGRLRDIDPIDVWDPVSANVLDQVAEGLFTYNFSDPSNAIIPNLAEDMGTWSTDYKNYTVSLKQGITFHDGTPFNATAVKFSVDRYQYFMNATGAIVSEGELCNTAELFMWYDGTLIINSTEIIDDYTIRFVLNHYYAPFEALLCFPAMYIISPTAHMAHATIRIFEDEYLIGTGPYKFVEIDPLVEVTFYAFENYWKGPAQIKSLIFSIIPDSVERFLSLRNGTVDMIDRIEDMLFRDITPANLSTLKADPDITVLDSNKTSATIKYIIMNNKHIDNTMRKAISYAIEYDNITQGILQDTVERLKSPIPNGILYANDTLNYPIYNIYTARQFLVDGGVVPVYYIDGVHDYHDWHQHVNGTLPPLAEYNYTYEEYNYIGKSIGLLLVDDLERIGIKVNLINMSFYDFLLMLYGYPGYSRDDFDLAFFGWTPDYNDPSNFINPLLRPGSYHNCGQVNDTILNAAMFEALQLTDSVARKAKYDQIQHRIIEILMPYAYTHVQKLYCAHHRDLTGFQQNLFNKLNFHICIWARQAPSKFNLTTDATHPDKDGIFNLNWTKSELAENYSIYQYSEFITKINGSLTSLINETKDLSHSLINYSDGIYYFIVEAHNNYGNTLSNCIEVVVQISEPFISGYYLYLLIGLFGVVSIWLVIKARFKTK